VEEVARELKEMQRAIGAGVDAAAFMRDALTAHGASVSGGEALSVDLAHAPTALREALGGHERFTARFNLPVRDGELYLNRTHPLVEGLATYVLDAALDPLGEGVARRCGVIRTSRVTRRTTLLLLRFRFHLVTATGTHEVAQLAEDCGLVAFAGAPSHAEWLSPEAAEVLLTAAPDANIAPDQARVFLERVIGEFDALRPRLDEIARERGDALVQAHRRVRDAARRRGVQHRVEAHLPPDVLGIYVYLPTA
jgi:hypothetical protein